LFVGFMQTLLHGMTKACNKFDQRGQH
jgi:hypothetical protein